MLQSELKFRNPQLVHHNYNLIFIYVVQHTGYREKNGYLQIFIFLTQDKVPQATVNGMAVTHDDGDS